MTTTTTQGVALSRAETIQYVGQNAGRFGLDPAAVLAVANGEGLGRSPDSGLPLTWWLPKEGGFNFGPPSWYSLGAGDAIVKAHGEQSSYWSWTPAGLDYWLQKVAESGASGLTGASAISTIVRNFERPAAENVGPNIQKAITQYASFLQQIQIPIPGSSPPPVIVPGPGGEPSPGPGPGQLPIPINPQTKPPASTPSKATFSMPILTLPDGKKISFTLPWDFSGILLFLAAIFAILIGALLWDKSRNVIVKGGEAAAVAAA